jgi:hypothetical protein
VRWLLLLWRGAPAWVLRRLEAGDVARCQFANDTHEEDE